jgi:hypothetical protein
LQAGFPRAGTQKTEFDRDVIAVEFSPDGRYLAAHDDTTVRI